MPPLTVVVIYSTFSIVLGLSHLKPNRILFEDKNGKIYYETLTEKTILKEILSGDVRLFLYTRQNLEHGCEFFLMSLDELRSCRYYNSTKENYFIIHGWKNTYESEISVVTKEAALARADLNVFVVDWGNIAKHNYFFCHSAVKLVGNAVAAFINDMMLSLRLSPKMFMLVGHSLGAHVAGCTGNAIRGSAKYIVGLDPAGPLFTLNNKDNRLDTGDAEFVQVIHTSITLLGFADSIGHADYYPNSGKHQPGCAVDSFGGCSHARSYMYYAESILRGGFSAIPCKSYKQFKNGQCDNGHKSYFGKLDLDISAHGDYYLDTNMDIPFSLN